MRQIKNQIGRTMIEMLSVLAIIGVITVSAIAGLDQAMTKFRISKMHDDILSINQSIVDLYAWQRRYPKDIDMQELCRNDVFPDGCISNEFARNTFGGYFTISSDPINSTIRIEADGLPSNVCNALASDDMDWGEYLVEGNNPTCGTNNSVFTIVFY